MTYQGTYVVVPAPLLEEVLTALHRAPSHDVENRLRQAAIPYEPDNHHNAAVCPYCNPKPALPTQEQVLAWVAERWPNYTSPVWRAIKAGEEAGEILGAVTKAELGLKPESQIAVESAQAVLCIMSLAESVGFDLWEAVAADWETMQSRVWEPAWCCKLFSLGQDHHPRCPTKEVPGDH